MTILSQAEAEAGALADAQANQSRAAYAIVLTSDDHGVPTHEHCPLCYLDTLYGPQIKAEIARHVATVRYIPGVES